MIVKESPFILLIFFLGLKPLLLYRLIATNSQFMHLKRPILLVLSILIFLCSLPLNAQTDSLQGKSYEELIKLHEATFHENPVKAEIYANAAYNLARKKNDSEKTMLAKYSIARLKYMQANQNESLKDLDEVIQIATKLNDNLLLFKSYNLKGNNLCDLKRDNEGFNEYVKARKYAKLTKNPIHISTVNINIALIKKTHKDYQEAIDILLENLSFLKTFDDSDAKKLNNERIVLMQLADTYLRISKPKEAEYYNNLAFEKASKKKSTVHYYWILTNDAIIKYQTKKYQQSITTCHEIEDYFISLNKASGLLTPYFYIGKSNYQLGKFSKAIEYLEKVITISEEIKKNFSELKETHKYLHLSYAEIGNSKKASKHFIKYSDTDKKNDSTDISLIKKMHKEHDIVPLQEEINTLGTYTKYLYGSLIILALSLIGLFVWYKRKQQQNKLRFEKLLITIEALEKPKEKIVVEEIVTKEVSSPVTDENALQILKALEAFEEKELYLRQDCTLGYVAKKVKTNTSYLSNVINTYKEKSFKSYLSELRINAALVQLKNDDRLRSYTIKAIAEEFGFKRSETFSRAFKAQTDIYPSVYIKNLDNQQNK